jgi:N-acetylglucosamine-6-phosphate deacetylase
MNRLIEAGATMLTHLGNGIPHNVHKFQNPLVYGLAADKLSAGIITDGHHLPPDIIKIILRTKGIDNCYVTSDCIHAAGFKPGKYTFAHENIELLENGKVVNVVTRR